MIDGDDGGCEDRAGLRGEQAIDRRVESLAIRWKLWVFKHVSCCFEPAYGFTIPQVMFNLLNLDLDRVYVLL